MTAPEALLQEDDIIFSVTAGVGSILLNRPKALNALTLDKIEKMTPVLRDWAADDSVRCVVIQGAGDKAFCAGGDIRALYDAAKAGNRALLETFFAEEYRLNRLIKTFPKPYVAVIDGIAMGGGVGVSIHGSHRVVTERTLFAMPETGIGMYPDVGGTYFLPRLPGRIGHYMALTGARLRAADCLYTGIATHYVPSTRLPDLLRALGAAETEALSLDDMQSAVTCVLDMFHEDPGPAPLEKTRAEIDRCFDAGSVEEVITKLKAEGTEWSEAILNSLQAKAPTALKVAKRQMQVGAMIDFDRCMQIEYRLARRFAGGPDFLEGVRAVIIDKDMSPKWTPAELSAVDQATVDALFGPLPDGDLTFS